MLTPRDIITISFSCDEQGLVEDMARQCWLGSDDAQHATRGTQQQDSSQYINDQIAGQYGELALHMLFYGRTNGTDYYIQQRAERNANKYAGDDGSDLWNPTRDSIRVDAKTSTMRYSRDPQDYTLIVRPRDWHDNTAYVLILRPPDSHTVHIVGYAWTEDLPEAIKSSGPFAGAYIKKARFLRSVLHLGIVVKLQYRA